MEPTWHRKSTPEACRRPPAPQEAPKSSKERPKKEQERPKKAPRAAESDFLDFPGLGFWTPGGWAAERQGRVLEGVGSQNTVFVWKVLQFSCFSEVLEKMAPPKLKLKL